MKLADIQMRDPFVLPMLKEGRYLLFGTTDKPEGPYRLHSDGPVTTRDWECLDGTLYVDPAGKPWMVFCHEWVQAVDGEMCAIPLSDDLRCAIGQPVLLFRASEAVWSRPFESQGRTQNQITDGPFLHRLPGGKLLMLWSTNGTNGAYAMGYAVSDGSILGPWRQSAEALYAQDGGHGMLFRDFGGRLWMTLHRPNNSPNERPMWIEVVEREGESGTSRPALVLSADGADGRRWRDGSPADDHRAVAAARLDLGSL